MTQTKNIEIEFSRPVVTSTYPHQKILNSQISSFQTWAIFDLSKNNMMAKLEAISGAMAKLKLIADSETSKAATELGNAFGSTFLRLLPQLLSLQEEKTDIEINNDFYNDSIEEIKRIQSEIDKIIQSGDINYLRFQALQSALDFASKQSQTYATNRSAAHEKHTIKLNTFHNILITEFKILSKIQLNLAIAARKDLGLDSNPQELRRQLELQTAVMEAAFGDSISALGQNNSATPPQNRN